MEREGSAPHRHSVTLPFSRALEPFHWSPVSGWQEREEHEHVDCIGGVMGQAGDGAHRFHSCPELTGQNSIPYLCLLLSLKKNYLFIFRERERQKKKGRETLMQERNWSVASRKHPVQGLNPQSRHVPWPGIEPADAPTSWATLVRAVCLLVSSEPGKCMSQEKNKTDLFGEHMILCY